MAVFPFAVIAAALNAIFGFDDAAIAEVLRGKKLRGSASRDDGTAVAAIAAGRAAFRDIFFAVPSDDTIAAFACR